MTHPMVLSKPRHFISNKSAPHSDEQIALNRAAHAKRKKERAELAAPKDVLLRTVRTCSALTHEEREAIAIAVQLFRISPSDCIRSAHRMAHNPHFTT